MGKNKSIPESLQAIIEGIKSYLGLKLEYLRVTSLEKVAGALSGILLAVFIIAMGFFVVLFLSLAFIWWYGEKIDNMALASLMAAGIWIFLALIIFFFRRPLIINPLIRHLFSEISFEETQEKEANIQSGDNE